MTKQNYQEAGTCPNCGSNNLSYGDTQLECESFGYEFVCDDCGTYGTEWYNLEYDETIVEGQDVT